MWKVVYKYRDYIMNRAVKEVELGDKLQRLLDRLARAALTKASDPSSTTDGSIIWLNGIGVIQRKYGVQIWLHNFKPKGMKEDKPDDTSMVVTIEPIRER
jgi:hypothetical protein